MLDVSVSYNRYKFLGYEYLTWLWFVVETDQDKITNLEQAPVSMEIGNRIVLQNKKKDAMETITIKGDDAGLEEGMLALRNQSASQGKRSAVAVYHQSGEPPFCRFQGATHRSC
jgi:hypothetical protein